MDSEFHSLTIETVDVGARGVTFEVEAVFVSASGDDYVLNQLAVDAEDREVGVERHVDRDHHVVGGRVGVSGSGGEGGVLFDAHGILFGEDIVDHSMSVGEAISACKANGR